MNERGLTLIEVIVAVAIFSLVSVSLFAGFSTAVKGWQRIEEAGEAGRAAYLFFARLESELKNAVFFAPAPFEGEGGRITFVTVRRGDGAFPEMARVGYHLEGETLRRSEERYSGAEQPWAAEGARRDRRLLEGVSEIKFQYAVGDENIGYSWIGVYKPVKGLPRAVKVAISMRGNKDDGAGERIIEIPAGGWEI